jgi:hypothetical protein
MPRRNLTLPPERELSQLAAPPKNQPLRIEDNPRSAGVQRLWRQCQVTPVMPRSPKSFLKNKKLFSTNNRFLPIQLWQRQWRKPNALAF